MVQVNQRPRTFRVFDSLNLALAPGSPYNQILGLTLRDVAPLIKRIWLPQ